MKTPDDAVELPPFEVRGEGEPAPFVLIGATGAEVLRISPDGTVHFKDQSEAARTLASAVTRILKQGDTGGC